MRNEINLRSDKRLLELQAQLWLLLKLLRSFLNPSVLITVRILWKHSSHPQLFLAHCEKAICVKPYLSLLTGC